MLAQNIDHIYSHHGLEPFRAASATLYTSTFSSSLYNRLSRHPDAYHSDAEVRTLLRKYMKIAPTNKRRHEWMVISVSERWKRLDEFGCAFDNCPERTELLELRDMRKRGVPNSDIEARLYSWGSESKVCNL